MTRPPNHRRPWAPQDDQYLIDNHELLTHRELAAGIGRTVATIHCRLAALGLTVLPRVCGFCRLDIPPSRGGRRRKFCDDTCRAALDQAYRMNGVWDHRRAEEAARAGGRCQQCGGPMPPAHDYSRHRIFCDRACSNRAWHERKRARLGKPVMPWRKPE